MASRIEAWDEEHAGGEQKVATTRRDATLREYHLTMTARWYLMDVPLSEIAERNGVTPTTVQADLAAIRAEWRKSQIADYNTLLNQQLARIDAIEASNWRAWEQSQTERTRVRNEARVTPRGQFSSAQVTKETGTGESSYMLNIRWCVEERSKLLGLYAAVKIAPTTPDGSRPYDPISDTAHLSAMLDRFLATGSVDEPPQIVDGSATERIP